MLPSETLRDIISKKTKIRLEAYSWQKGFIKKVFNIDFVDGSRHMTLETIFKEGLNIGNCLLTAYHISSIIPNAIICTGKVDLVKGTKNAPKGDHVWIEDDSYIYDTTLMVKIPRSAVLSGYYINRNVISPDLSGNTDVSFSHDIYLKENFPKLYYKEIYSTKGKKRRKV